MFFLSSRFLKFLGRIHNAHVDLELFQGGGLAFFLDEGSLFRFFKFAEKLSKKIPNKQRAKLKGEKHEAIIELLKWPKNLNIEECVDWVKRIGEKTTNYYEIIALENDNKYSWHVEFVPGLFFNVLSELDPNSF